jgi:CRP/FNR family transcriptional regulator, cyclic AMP receptor protein
MVHASSEVAEVATAHRVRRSRDDLDRSLARGAPFHALSEVGRRRLLDESRLACFGPKDVLYEAGAPANALFLLLEGAIQIECPKSGRRRGRVVAMVEAPYMLGEAQVLHDRAFSGAGVALREVIAALIAKSTLEQLIQTEPAFAVAYARELAFRFLQAIEARQQTNPEPSIALAKYIVSYCALAGCDLRRIPLEQCELGEATGLCRETVNRTLKAWVRAGHLRVTRGGIEGVDVGALRGLIEGAGDSLVQVTAEPHSSDRSQRRE